MDESCDFAVVRALREAGFSVWVVAEEAPRSTDPEVLERATSSGAVLLTEDRDFGRLVFGERVAAHGVVLMRYPSNERLAMARRLVDLANSNPELLERSFVTLTLRGARARPLPSR